MTAKSNVFLQLPAAADAGKESLKTPLLTRPECARALRISVRKLDAMCKARQIPFFKLGGKILFRYDRCLDALDRMEQQEGSRV